MNENIDLTKILKDCPKGWKFYSTLYGEVEFEKIKKESEYPIVIITKHGNNSDIKSDGRYYGEYDGGECTFFPSKDQRDWSKFTAPWYKKEKFDQKMVKPKFKVGDMVRHKETNKDDVYEISKVYDDSYGIAGFTWMIYMKYQDQYELVPNKFDPKTLKPFDNVLVRDSYGDTWKHRLFSHINKNEKFPYMCIEHAFSYCIPYNNDTKHLESTTEEAPDYYRYWED